MQILRCMGSKFCVKFQRCPMKFHTKFWTHTPQNVHFTVLLFCVWVTISLNCDVISLSETGPWCVYYEDCVKIITVPHCTKPFQSWKWKMHLKMSSAKRRPFCPGRDELNTYKMRCAFCKCNSHFWLSWYMCISVFVATMSYSPSSFKFRPISRYWYWTN